MTTVFDLTCCPSAFVAESILSHNVEAHHGLVPKLGHHGGKNIANAQKPNFHSWFLLFLPLMMFSVAKQRVMMTGRVRERALRRNALTSTRKLEELKHQQRSFEGFCP